MVLNNMLSQIVFRVPGDLKKRAQIKALKEGVSLKSILEKSLTEYVSTAVS